MTKVLGATFVAIGLGLAAGSKDAAVRGFGLSLLASLSAGYIVRALDRLDPDLSTKGGTL